MKREVGRIYWIPSLNRKEEHPAWYICVTLETEENAAAFISQYDIRPIDGDWDDMACVDVARITEEERKTLFKRLFGDKT
jgi:hypothetical protein